MTKRLLALLFIFTLPAITHGAPTINSHTGTLTHGNSQTIGCTNCGTRPTVVDVYDNFENSTWNAYWTQRGATKSELGTIVNSGTYGQRSSNSSYESYINGDSSHDRNCLTGDSGTVDRRWYASYWVKLDSDWDWGTTSFCGNNKFLSNIKLFRMWNPGTTCDDTFVAYSGVSGSGAGEFQVNQEYNCGAANLNYFYLTARTDFTLGVWHLLEFLWLGETNQSSNDGQLHVMIDGITQLSSTGRDDKHTENLDKRPFLIGFQNEWRPSEQGTSCPGTGPADPSDDSPNRMAMDDVFAVAGAGAWARAYISTSATLALSTPREPQPITSWTDTQVVFTYNAGQLSSGLSKFLYLCDNTNSCNSNGFVLAGGGVGETVLSPAVVSVKTSSIAYNWPTGGNVNYTAAISTDINMVPVTSSGPVLAASTAAYANLATRTTYYFKVKLATASDAAYSAVLTTVTAFMNLSESLTNVTSNQIQANFTNAGVSVIAVLLDGGSNILSSGTLTTSPTTYAGLVVNSPYQWKVKVATATDGAYSQPVLAATTLPGPAGAPNITAHSGLLISSNAQTLTGTNFSSRTTTVEVYDGFETNGWNVYWSPGAGTTQSEDGVIVSTYAQRSANSLYCSYIAGYSGPSDSNRLKASSSTVAERWYTSRWVKLDGDWDWGTTGLTGNNKFLGSINFYQQWNPDDAATDNFLYWYDGANNTFSWQQNFSGGANTGNFYSNARANFSTGTWHLMEERWKDETNQTSSDAELHVSIDGISVLDLTGQDAKHSENQNKRPYILGFQNRYLASQNGGGGADPSDDAPNRMAMDDVFAVAGPGAWARVYVATSATLATAVPREPQRIGSWSDNQIVFNYVEGALPAGTKYAYVCDNTNSCNAVGFALTNPGGSGTSLNVSVSGVQISSASFNWTTVPGNNFVTALSSNSNFAPVVSSGTVLAASTAAFTNLATRTTYYFETKLSTEGDAYYNSVSTLTPWTNLAESLSGIQALQVTGSWSATGVNVIAVLKAGAATISSGTLAASPTIYLGLTPSTQYTWTVKVATESDNSYSQPARTATTAGPSGLPLPTRTKKTLRTDVPEPIIDKKRIFMATVNFENKETSQ